MDHKANYSNQSSLLIDCTVQQFMNVPISYNRMTAHTKYTKEHMAWSLEPAIILVLKPLTALDANKSLPGMEMEAIPKMSPCHHCYRTITEETLHL